MTANTNQMCPKTGWWVTTAGERRHVNEGDRMPFSKSHEKVTWTFNGT